MIFSIILFALVLRMVGVNQSLWLDEAIGALAARDYTFTTIVTEFLKADNHPPLYYLVLRLSSLVFGYSELSLRMPTIMFGLLTIYFTYLIVKQFADSKVATLSAFFLATSQFHIYYSQEARMYSMAAFLVSALVLVFVKSLDKSEVKNWALFSLLLFLLMWTDYMPIFMLPVFWLYGLIKVRNKSWWIGFVASHLSLGVLAILWYPTFALQSASGKWLVNFVPEWTKLAGGATFKQAALVWMKFTLGRVSLINKNLYYLLVLLISPTFIFGLFKAMKVKNSLLIWLWLVVPLLLGFIYSFSVPAFIYFRFLYILPAFYILLAQGVMSTKKSWLRNSVLGLLIFTNMLGWINYVSDENQQREQWRQASQYVYDNSTADSIAVFEYPEPFAPYRWYQYKTTQSFGALDSIVLVDKMKVDEKMAVYLKDKNKVFHFEYLRDLSDSEKYVEKKLQDSGFIQGDEQSFVGVGKVTTWQR